MLFGEINVFFLFCVLHHMKSGHLLHVHIHIYIIFHQDRYYIHIAQPPTPSQSWANLQHESHYQSSRSIKQHSKQSLLSCQGIIIMNV